MEKIPNLKKKEIEKMREEEDSNAKEIANNRNKDRSLKEKLLGQNKTTYKDIAHENAIREDISRRLDFPWKNRKNPTKEEMEKFFTQEVISKHLLFCPKINIDQTDEWGAFGYEEGFIFIDGVVKEGINSFNDESWEKGESLKFLGASIPVLPHYDFFPRSKFNYKCITPSRYPEEYIFLRKKLGNPKFLEEKKSEKEE